MRRTELERQLKALGYHPIGQSSGQGHEIWLGPNGKIKVPVSDLILESVAADILNIAKG